MATNKPAPISLLDTIDVVNVYAVAIMLNLSVDYGFHCFLVPGRVVLEIPL